MKKQFYSVIMVAGLVIINAYSFGQANTTLSNLESPTAVNKNLLPDIDNKENLGTTTKSWKNFFLDGTIFLDGLAFVSNNGIDNTFIGSNAGAASTGGGNTFIGAYAGNTNTSGFNNSYAGQRAGYSNTTGYDNAAFGASALYSNTDGFYNAAFGYNALYSNTTGSHNAAFGKEALYGNTTGLHNSAFGNAALATNSSGFYNSAFGFNALIYNTSGYENSALGNEALSYNTTGYYNAALGSQALYANSTGALNSALGTYCMTFNTSGSYNSAGGAYALYNNTTGGSNTAFGYDAMYASTIGHHNAAYGEYAGFNATVGNYNSFFGAAAGYGNTSGFLNTFIGQSAGDLVTTGNSNTCLGASTDIDVASLTNATALGYDASATASHQVRIGNTAVTSIGGYADWTKVSDGRFKKNVMENVSGLEFISKLRPVTYTLDLKGINQFITSIGEESDDQSKLAVDLAIQEKEKIVYTGFIAQEVEIAAKAAGFVFSGVDAPKNEHDLYGLRYAEFVVPLVKAVQELNEQNEILKNKNELLEQRISVLESMVNQQSISNASPTKFEIDNSKSTILGQNVPNPFDRSTIIPFRVPANCKDASIVISEASTGRIVKVIPVACTETQIQLNAGTLVNGSYTYSLNIDGKRIDSKQMEVVK